MKKNSQRFQPSAWMRWMVPLFLALILVGLAAVLALIFLSVAGVMPG